MFIVTLVSEEEKEYQAQVKGNKNNMDEASIGYELEMVPNKSAEDKKTGITIKGKDVEYREAHRILKDFFLTRTKIYH